MRSPSKLRGARARVVLALVALACAKSGGPSPAAPANADAGPGASAPTATPVTVVPVRRRTLAVRVSGPGVTTALQVEAVRAPFAGTLTDLRVQDGDRVTAGQVIGHVLSRDSAAALEGARAMLRSARTPRERSDAERALAIAERTRVGAILRAARGGVVVAHQATAGAIVAREQEIVSIAATGSIAFVAQIDQAVVARIRPGESASVEIPALRETLAGRVHSVLPVTGAAGGFTAPVRIDLTSDRHSTTTGLFGTARVVVAEVHDAQVVPSAAVIRDDITGVTRLALVGAADVARWVDVETGIEEDGAVQIVSPRLPEGARVITTGLVGLPEGTHVEVQP